MKAPLTVWYDGCYRTMNTTPRGLLEQGLHYGTGVFEGIRAYATARGPAIFRLDAHLERMGRGAETLAMPIDLDALGEASLELLRKNELEDAYIRPIAFYGGGRLHLDVHDLLLRQAVATLPWTSHLGEGADERGIRMRTSSYRRNSRRSIPPLKLCGAYVNSILAKLEATRAGFDEALFIDEEGYVCEATGENVFLVRDGAITAVDHPDALPGITRDAIIQIAGAESRRVTLEELRGADEIFVTGTSAEVTPVTALDERDLAIGPITRALKKTYMDIVHGQSPSYDAWLTYA